MAIKGRFRIIVWRTDGYAINWLSNTMRFPNDIIINYGPRDTKVYTLMVEE